MRTYAGRKQLNVHIPTSLRVRLQQHAEASGKTQNEIVEKAIAQYLNRRGK